MRPSFAILCIGLALAGCRGSGGGLLGRITIPPPGTQAPGALLADNAYYPRPAATTEASTPTIPVPSSAPLESQPSFTPVAERRGAAIARSTLGAPARTPAPAAAVSREEPIRIPDNSASADTLASVVRIQGIPTTDATALFQTARTQLQPQAILASRTPPSSGFVEISQLPNAPAPRLR